ncbi:putative V-set and immunoglobulin domain-containing protein 10-like [Scophthalmus maximus]|uniref:V-set and immunoglobulin domain containing 10 like n=1 Tax=Scophthalmus maximus TaxID=52904 RepID=A0A8D2ZV66_SCOMX|nr:putative V-set and immunoglobulin domain-containing protein 10-like [Scophthalmus maximus]
MMLPDESARLGAVFLVVSLSFSVQGAYSELLVFPSGPTVVNARAGSNVTLAVSFSGAPDPVVTWFKGGLPVLTWAVGSSAAPDVAEDNREVLSVEADGSLTFVNVPLGYTSNYTVKMTKSGLGEAQTAFTLKVFDIFQDVELSMLPPFAKEGSDRFTLRYAMSQGVVEQQTWLFNEGEIKTSSHYSVEQSSLVILNPKRGDTGWYTVILTNPFSRASTRINVTVLYGPEEPIVEARPPLPFYVSGDSLSLFCRAEGIPQPTAEWIFGGQTLSDSREGVLNRTNVHVSQGGVYMCKLINELTKEQLQRSMTLSVYERPSGNPTCSVQSVNVNADLQYHCQWLGGTPLAQLSFPALSSTSSGAGNFSMTVPASDTFNGKTVKCMAVHPVEQNQCNITASSPAEFLPAVRTTVNSEGKIVVAIHCVSEAAPQAVVSWSKGSEAVTNGTTYQISNDTTHLKIHGYNVSNFLQQKYTCTCRNPLGSQRLEIQLRGPSVSRSSLFPNQDGTIITLTWEVPSTSIVTGFDVQMKGPDLVPEIRNSTQTRATSNEYRTVQQKPGSARSADVFLLDPDLTYRFRVVPKARLTDGEPSEVHRIGPGEGLSGPAITGIAAGIPCSLLFLLLLGGLIYLCIYCNKNKSRQARYPVSRAVEKAITTQSETTPHNLLTGGLKSPPDYNRLQLTPSERSVALPTFVPPPPVRVATTV